jgi:hypothetical protein
MTKIFTILFVSALLQSTLINAQKPSGFLPAKSGKWNYTSHVKSSGAETVALNKNLASLAEWFHQNVPMLHNPEGYDLDARAYDIWDDHYKRDNCNYGLRAQMEFGFQLFLSSGGKWTIEPPHYSFYINNTETGHGTNYNFPGWDNTKDPPAMQAPLEKTVTKLNGLFRTFTLDKKIAPGVSLYGDGNLIVFNPGRPPFWIPVTVREVAEIKLDYYKFREVFLLPVLKEEIARLSENEMNAIAFSGNEELFVLNVHPKSEDQGKEDGGQIMRFNPDYWDRTLPPSAIQFLTLRDPGMDQAGMEEHFRDNGYPDYGQLIINSLNMNELAGLIMKKK